MSADPKPTRKTRTMIDKPYIATVHGLKLPVVVIAKTQDAALKAVVTIRPATFADMKQAGRDNYTEINATTGEQTVVDESKSEAPLKFGSGE